MKRKGKKRVKGGKRKGEEKRERKLNEGEKIGGRKEKEKQYEAKKKGKVRGRGKEREKLLTNTVHTLYRYSGDFFNLILPVIG